MMPKAIQEALSQSCICPEGWPKNEAIPYVNGEPSDFRHTDTSASWVYEIVKA